MQERVIIAGHIFNNGPNDELGRLHNVNIRSALSGVFEYTVAKEKRRKWRNDARDLLLIHAFSAYLKRF